MCSVGESFRLAFRSVVLENVVLCLEPVICFFWKPWFEQDDRPALAPRVLVLWPSRCMEGQQAMSADEPIGPASERVPSDFHACCGGQSIHV